MPKPAEVILNPRFHGSPDREFVAHFEDYTPSNKRRGEFERARAELAVYDYNGRKPGAVAEAWTSLCLREVVTPYRAGTCEPGRPYERVISVTLDAAARAKLRAYLDACDAFEWPEK